MCCGLGRHEENAHDISSAVCPRCAWLECLLFCLCNCHCEMFDFAYLAMWACCDDTSSDDDEHYTSNSLLLLSADVFIAPFLLSGLCDVDELTVALVCSFALDLFTVAQHDWAETPQLRYPVFGEPHVLPADTSNDSRAVVHFVQGRSEAMGQNFQVRLGAFL